MLQCPRTHEQFRIAVDHAHACVFVSGHRRHDAAEPDWASLARPEHTLVIYMGLGPIAELCDKLVLHGLAPSTPAAAIEKQGAAAQGVRRVVAGKPQRKTIRLSTTQPGRIEDFEETPLLPKLSGYVDKVLVDMGDQVTKGQTLVTIAVPEMHDELEHKRALVAQAEAEVKQAEVAVEGAKAADEAVHAHPYQAIAIGVGVGALVGYLIARQCSSKRD